MKVKKIFITLSLCLVIFIIFDINASAYYLLPKYINEYSSLDAIPNFLGDFGGGTKIQQTKYHTSPSNDLYVIVYKAKKRANISFYDHSRLFDLNNSMVGSNITFEQCYRKDLSTTYEEIIGSEATMYTKSYLETRAKFPIYSLSSGFSNEFLSKVSSSVTKTTTKMIEKSSKTNINFIIQEPGYYILQERADYEVYIVLLVSVVYDVKVVNSTLTRIKTSPSRIFLTDRYIHFSYYGNDTLGVTKYIRDSSLDDNLTVDDSNYQHDNIVYL